MEKRNESGPTGGEKKNGNFIFFNIFTRMAEPTKKKRRGRCSFGARMEKRFVEVVFGVVVLGKWED